MGQPFFRQPRGTENRVVHRAIHSVFRLGQSKRRRDGRVGSRLLIGKYVMIEAVTYRKDEDIGSSFENAQKCRCSLQLLSSYPKLRSEVSI